MLADLLLRPRFPSTGVSACPAGGTSCAAADEVRTTISYGANLQPSSVASGSGDGALAATTAMTYDLAGNLVTVDGPLPGTADTVRYFYNAARERVGTISPDPDGTGPLPNRAQRLTFNPVGQVTKVEVGTTAGQSDAAWAAMVVHEAAEIFYDDDSRKVKETLVAGATTHAVVQYSYDALGRLDCTAQRMNPDAFGSLPNSACNHGTMGDFGRDRLSRTFYDAASRVLKVQSGIGTDWARDDVTNTYTPNGRLATVTDAEANRTTWEYDLFDRLEKTRYPSKTIPNQSSTLDFELFAYDAGSRVTSRTLRDGTVIAFGYDDLDRLVLKDLPGAETSTTYVYDWLNRLTSAAQVNVDATFVHDALSRVTGSTAFLASGINLTTAYQYDLAGRRTRITHDDGFIVTYNHLVTGETISVREGVFGDPASVMLATYDYDDRRRRIAINRTNSTTTTYSYDPISRLTALTQNMPGTTGDLTLGFSNYNPAGQIGRTTRDNDSYVFDDHVAGTIPSTANGLNQLTQVDAEPLQYDPRGNLTSDASAPGGTASYGYSAENMLTSATVGGQQVTLQYDPLMRLRTTSGTGLATRRFVYDGVDLISEHNGPGTLVRRYVHGPGMDEPLVEYTGTDNSTRRWLHADERGSVVAISDGTGAAVVKNTYDEYGNPGAGNDGRFQYTGQTWIPELKLYYYKARFYDPRLGRFMQTDPIGYGGGMNMYAYVGGDPVNAVDPSGLIAENCTGTRLCSNVDGTGNPFGIGQSGTHYSVRGGKPGGGSIRICIKHCGDEAHTDPVTGNIVVYAGTFINIGASWGDIVGFLTSSATAGNQLMPQSGISENYPGQETDETEEENQRDIVVCYSLSDPGAQSRCFQSANRRDYQRRWGKPVEELETRRDISPVPTIPLPSPRCLKLRHPILIGACAIITG